MENTVDGWHPNAEEGTHLAEEKSHPVPLPSLPDKSSITDLQGRTRRKHKRVHARKQRAESQKVKTGKHVLPSSTSALSAKVRPFDTGTLAHHGDRRKDNHQVPHDLTKLHLSTHQIVKLEYVRAIIYGMYRLNDCSTWYNDSVFHYVPKIVKKLCSQMKAQNFDTSDPGSVLSFLTTFKLE